MKPVCAKYGLTQMEFDIIMFLHHYPESDTAADIVKLRRFTKSHVSASVKTLTEKGLVTTRHTDGNRKFIRISLTDAVRRITEEGEEAQKDFGAAMLKGFTADEIVECVNMYERLCKNAREILDR